MAEPVKTAFCPIFFGANGGQFTESGVPILTEENTPLGTCDRAFDCGTCPHLTRWVQGLIAKDGWEVGWECDACLKKTKKSDEEEETRRVLPGFYQSGRAHRDPDDPEYDPDQPQLIGCTRCGWETSFLQLVLRR